MKRKGMKIAALALAGAVACMDIAISSAAGIGTRFPAAGFALIIGDGVPINEVVSKADKSTGGKAENAGSIVAGMINSQHKQNDAQKVQIVPDTAVPLVSAFAAGQQAEEDARQPGQEQDNPFASREMIGVNKAKDDASAENGDAAGESASDGSAAKESVSDNSTPSQSVSDNDSEKASDTVSGNEAKAPEQSVSDNEEKQDFSSLVIAKVDSYVNVRAGAGEEHEIVGKLYNKSVGTLLEEDNGWYKINSGKVEGYVKKEYCVTGAQAEAMVDAVGEKVAVVTTTTLKVRSAPGLDAEVLGLVPGGEELSVLEEMDGWVKVSIEEGEGYVSQDYVTIRVDFVAAESKEEEEARLKKEEEARKAARAAANAKIAQAQPAPKAPVAEAPAAEAPAAKAPAPEPPASSTGSAAGQAVVNYAMQFVGNPYVYGGTSLTNGADCSGFVMSVYANFGVSLPHSSTADRRMGYDVGGLANAQPGDLVCYSGHVGIYAGNGRIVHASSPRTGITVSDAGYRQVLAVRRIF